MADFIMVRRGRNILSSITHVILNILLGVGSIALTVISGSWVLGVFLVFLSKWRIWAVRYRFWFLNLKANLVDLIVGISIVLIAYCSGTELLPIHFILAAIYTIWLIFIKPRSSTIATEAQSLIAIFLGTTAITMITAGANSIFCVLPAFLVGYGASRHVLAQSDDDKNFTLITLLCGLVTAELTWLAHSWLIVYTIDSIGIIIPQLAIILTLLSFLFGRAYHSIIKHDGKLNFKNIAMPTFFTVLTIAIIFLWFSKPFFEI